MAKDLMTDPTKVCSVTNDDPRVTDLLQAVADAVAEAQNEGVELSQALSLVIIAATEYGRAAFGEDVIESFCQTIRLQRGEPLPYTNVDEIAH